MIILLLLSLAAAVILDSAIHAPLGNVTEDGKAVTVSSDFGETQVVEAGFWDDLKDWFGKVGRTIKVVYCLYTTIPTDWGECY